MGIVRKIRTVVPLGAIRMKHLVKNTRIIRGLANFDKQLNRKATWDPPEQKFTGQRLKLGFFSQKVPCLDWNLWYLGRRSSTADPHLPRRSRWMSIGVLGWFRLPVYPIFPPGKLWLPPNHQNLPIWNHLNRTGSSNSVKLKESWV